MITKAQRERALNRFAYRLLKFLSDSYDCHNCKYPQSWVNRKGRERTICSKYNLPLKSVRNGCVDRFPGFNNKELMELAEQYHNGEMTLVLNGAAV